LGYYIGHGNESCVDRKLVSRNVVSPPGLNEIHCILETLQRLINIVAVGITLSFDKKVCLAMVFAVV